MIELLDATADRFGGLVMDQDALPTNADLFAARLAQSLSTWMREGFPVVWVTIPLAHAALIPIAAAHNFQFHHSSDTKLTMICRLKPDAYVPPYATHYIGAGGVVINEQNELLVVSEKFRRDKSRPYYKLPGGALNPGEHLVDGVIREVLEETGVHVEFETLACFRHWHGYRFGKSDLYFICRLRPLSHEISVDETEIEESIWMPIDEYLSSDFVGTFNKKIVQAALESSGISSTWVDGYDNHATHEFFFPQE